MEFKSERKEQIKALQENLTTIRKIAGWTMEDFGSLIGVTKQTISNIENLKTEMSLTQYIAIRAVLDHEIQTDKSNKVLPQIIDLLLDKREEYSESEISKIEEAAKSLSAIAASGVTGESLSAASSSLLSSFIKPSQSGIACMGIGFTVGHTLMTGLWLSKIAKSKKSK